MFIEKIWVTPVSNPAATVKEDSDKWEEYSYEDGIQIIVPDIEDVIDAYRRLLNKHPSYDQFFNSGVQLQYRDRVSVDTVNRQALEPDVVTSGTYNDKPIMNLIIYEV